MNIVKTPSFELATYTRGDVNAEKFALVLPGRLDSKDYPHMRSHVDFLASNGYFAVSFDPPGTWESPGGIEIYTMTNYLKAVKELIIYYGSKPTILVGHSRGGSMAMLGGTTIPQVTHFVAIMSRLSSAVAGDENEYMSKGKNFSYRDTPPNNSENQMRFDLPYSYFEDAAQYDMSEDVKNCTKPKLFFYGTKDELVTQESVEDIFNYAAEPKQIHGLDVEHDYRRHPDIIDEVNTIIEKFLEENL